MLTFRILELAVEESEGVNNPLPVGPAVDVFVVALNVCIAELLFVLVAAAAFDQESPVHPCLIALSTQAHTSLEPPYTRLFNRIKPCRNKGRIHENDPLR